MAAHSARVASAHELTSHDDTIDESAETARFLPQSHPAWSDLPVGSVDGLFEDLDDDIEALEQGDAEQGPLIPGAEHERKPTRRRRRVADGEATAVMDGDVLMEGNLDRVGVVEQISLRAILVGLIIGSSLVFSNMYFGLQTGWVTMASLPSALLGYIILHRFSSFTPQENVLVQTVAVATGTMPLAAGFVGVIIAMGEVGPEDGGPVRLSPAQMAAWTAALAFFGVFFAVGMRGMAILRERLRFPSGTATAVLIKLLHSGPNSTVPNRDPHSPSSPTSRSPTSAGPSGPARTPLLYSFLASSIYTILSYFVPVLYNAPVLSWIGIPSATRWGWWLTPSLSYVGQGMIMGPHTTLSMLAGALFGWAMLGPFAESRGWCKGVFDWKNGAQGWILWVSLSLMLAESISSFALFLVGTLRAIAQRRPATADPVPRKHLVPPFVAYGGLVLSTVICATVVGPMFGVSWLKVGIAVLVGCGCAVVAVRTLGEIDVNPVSGIGKISQLIFAAVAPGSVVANLVAGAIAEAGAQQAGDLLQDLKTGHLLSASPYVQFIGQLIGSIASIPLTVGAFQLYTSVYQVPGPELGAPTAAIWLDMARIVNGGRLPESVLPWCIGAGVVGALLPVVEWGLSIPIKANEERGISPSTAWGRAAECLNGIDWDYWRRIVAIILPSGVGFAIGMYITPNFVLPRVAGGIASHLWQNYYPKSWRGGLGIIVASGFVLGEGVTSLLVALIKAWGVTVWTCLGCGGPGGVRCGGCPA
ncbi:OPT superfamily oligopeptide transporter [Gonapodya prolifera JEL478]|uniref:OPT superfamily oligopeptide transporter n=1 Tax=Gonapodya prolifera (strain JEL478) TaxID=1344416 RepID=A0A139AV68_GONPJ|nr:OPT superfamily oligopeptide transporter [Gonapodya prolifera JEL478]|eukprot:KXS20618.1 OPT superfamily oligopeptide transporter [Gonapodya prolifera JEL478]